MKNKALRHLNKIELLTLLRDQEAEIEALKEEISHLQSKLETQNIQKEKYGSIAEAALQMNHIFEIAQQAADTYVSSVKQMKDKDASYGMEEFKRQRQSYFQEIYDDLEVEANLQIEKYKQREYRRIDQELKAYKALMLKKMELAPDFEEKKNEADEVEDIQKLLKKYMEQQNG